MPDRPTMGMKVSNISATIKFCVEKFGFIMVDYLPYADIAHILDTDKDLFLLIGPKAKDIDQHLDPPRFILKPGETLRFLQDNLEALNATLVAKGVEGISIEDGWLGDRTLSVPGPDNYTFAFIKRASHTSKEVLAQYTEAPQRLEGALAGLPESALDLSIAANQWTIRKIVHHLAESESLFMLQIKTALAASGSVYIRNTYDQDVWPETLEYAKRAIEPSIALVKAVHGHIVQLLQYIPDYEDRYVIVKAVGATDEGKKNTVGYWLETMARHLWEHCEEIREIRRIHGV